MRNSGILMHISSLPSPYGIGTLGKSAYKFVDFLKASGQRNWQMLPLTTTGYGDSPYQSFSVYAGNHYFIDFDILKEKGLLYGEDLEEVAEVADSSIVDYSSIYKRVNVLRKAYKRFDANKNKDFQKFCDKNAFWLDGYALFMTIKTHFNDVSWQEWPLELKNREEKAIKVFEENKDEINFYKFTQFEFFLQFEALKSYANKNMIKLIGDIPIYVSEDSADVWCNAELFLLDSDNRPLEMAGCPPDYFSADGQFWGNPIYNWEKNKQEGYKWWVSRVKYMMDMYDVLRIDHFRGFSAYFSIPKGKKPVDGVWKKGPGMDIFNAIKKSIPNANIIAEDLGYLDDDVRQLLKDTAFPGMKVLQFAFDSREKSNYMPHHYDRNCVVYTGTHDNDTILGWYDNADPADVKLAGEYLNVSKKSDYPWAFIRAAWASVSDLAIAPMQDFLVLDSSARMNIPSTVGGNWAWRITNDLLTQELAKKIYHITDLYERL